MAWSVRNVNGTAGTSTTLSVTAGDLIVVMVPFQAALGTPTVSDGVNTYVQQVQYLSDRPSICSILSAIAQTTASLTITASGVSNIDSVQAGAFFHGSDTPVATADTTGTVPGFGNPSLVLTTSTANTLLTGGADSSGSLSPGSGFTFIAQITGGMRSGSEYNGANNSAGSNTVNFTAGQSRGMCAAAFKYTSGGGGVSVASLAQASRGFIGVGVN